jgi:signal transduction histidine kinase
MWVYVVTALSYQNILSQPQGATIFINNLFFVVGANLAGMATCYSLELSARRAFVSNFLLEEERLGEQRKRERTEAMLHVLSQAIGGVVHDLGNPLTSVQTGVQTLNMLLEEPTPDPKMMRELTGFIDRGAQMLNALRLSLMEQTRVLEGKPTPVDLRPTPVGMLVENGVRHQNPRYSTNRSISTQGEECVVCADQMKLITVLMNLIGNALKYSDGDVRIEWHVENNRALIAVCDQGRNGRGITHEQAQKLFVAFGRLDEHSKVEGTGLGLLSVRHIVAAHDGEVFIESTLDGTPHSAPFSTAQAAYSSVLAPGFRTAFVVTCPLA